MDALCSDCPPVMGVRVTTRCTPCPRRIRLRGPFKADQSRGPYRTEAGAMKAHDRAVKAGFTKSGVIRDGAFYYLLVA